MFMVLMFFCAAGAVFLIGVGAYTEFRDSGRIRSTEWWLALCIRFGRNVDPRIHSEALLFQARDFRSPSHFFPVQWYSGMTAPGFDPRQKSIFSWARRVRLRDTLRPT